MFRERPLVAYRHELSLLTRNQPRVLVMRRIHPRPSVVNGYLVFSKDLRVKYGSPAPDELLQRCPYGQPGDHLWVRERFRVEAGRVVYQQGDSTAVGGWKQAITLPRNSCRFVVRVLSVRAVDSRFLRSQAPEISDEELLDWDRYNEIFPLCTFPWVWLLETLHLFAGGDALLQGGAPAIQAEELGL